MYSLAYPTRFFSLEYLLQKKSSIHTQDTLDPFLISIWYQLLNGFKQKLLFGSLGTHHAWYPLQHEIGHTRGQYTTCHLFFKTNSIWSTLNQTDWHFFTTFVLLAPLKRWSWMLSFQWLKLTFISYRFQTTSNWLQPLRIHLRVKIGIHFRRLCGDFF